MSKAAGDSFAKPGKRDRPVSGESPVGRLVLPCFGNPPCRNRAQGRRVWNCVYLLVRSELCLQIAAWSRWKIAAWSRWTRKRNELDSSTRLSPGFGIFRYGRNKTFETESWRYNNGGVIEGVCRELTHFSFSCCRIHSCWYEASPTFRGSKVWNCILILSRCTMLSWRTSWFDYPGSDHWKLLLVLNSVEMVKKAVPVSRVNVWQQ